MDYFILHKLPPLRNLISIGDNILINEWSFENKNYKYDERVEIMEKYEFIIAHLILSISFLKIDRNLLTTINKIYKKATYYNNRYFRSFKKNDPFLKIIYFYEFQKNIIIKDKRTDNIIYFDCGVYNDVDDTILFYKFWNEFYEYIFGKSNEYLTIDDILKNLKKKNAEKPTSYDTLIKYIKIPKTNFNEVIDLLSIFDRNMNRYEKSEKIYIIRKAPATKNENIDFRNELLKKHKKLKGLFDTLKKITNDDDEYYIEESQEKKIFKWNGTKVLFTVLIMTYLEKHTYETDFWKSFDNAFDSKFRDSAKQYLDNLSVNKTDKNLKKPMKY